MPSELKMLMAQELADRYRQCSNYVVVSHTKLTGQETTEMRKTLREHNVRMSVVKNSIAARALESCGMGEGTQFFQGPSALMVGDLEMPELCKVVTECAKKFENKLLVRGGMMDGKPLMPEIVKQLASIPPLPILHVQIVSSIQAPITMTAAAFQSLIQSLAYVIEEIRNWKEEGKTLPSAP